MVEKKAEKPDARESMYNGRYDNKVSIGGGIHILGERNFDEEEEDQKEVEELKMVQELTQSINWINKEIAQKVDEQDEGFDMVENDVEQAAIESAHAGENIREASRSKFQTVKYKLGTFFGAIGAGVGAIFGAVPGAVVGGAGGAVIGAGVGKGMEKAGEKRLDKLEFRNPGQPNGREHENNNDSGPDQQN